MDYRMWKGTVNANENVVPIIIQDAVNSDGLRRSDRIYFVGFNGNPGTEFYLNNSNSPMEIPDSGYFITPYFVKDLCQFSVFLLQKILMEKFIILYKGGNINEF